VGRVASDVPDGLAGDPGRLRQVLVNLLGNAVKFTERGCVRLDVQRGSEAHSLEIRVSDTGIGIPEAKQARIFDSFTQADGSVTREYGGTGLGLTISTRLVAAMGGTLDVTSAPGAGSTFRVRIPLQVAAAAGAEEHPPLPPPGLRALVVDDQELERETVAQHLGHWGIDVELAASGAEGLERATKADREGDPFDLVFVDCRMPGMTGFDVFERLARELQSAARVVMMLTTDHRRGDIQLCADAGLGGYLLKPVKETALRELVLAMTTDRESSAPDAAERELPWTSERGLRVLLAEDSNDNQLLVRAYLRDTPHELRVVENGLEAVEACRREVFDVVLMDVQMPVQDGLSATREIRAFERRIGRRPTPIIALTANAFEGESEASRAAGCDTHVTKPISRRRLVDLLAGKALPPRGDPPRRRLAPPDDVAELLPGYLENRQQELPRLFDALEGRDFEPIRVAGHNMKGTGAAYGCPELGEIGARLEAAARLANGADVEEGLLAVGELLKSFEIVPAPGVGAAPLMEDAT
jgi:CheY-like chemotaxis protein